MRLPLFIIKWSAYRNGCKEATIADKRFLKDGERKHLFEYADGLVQRCGAACDEWTQEYRKRVETIAELFGRLTGQLANATTAFERAQSEFKDAEKRLVETSSRAPIGDTSTSANVIFNYRIYPLVMAALAIFEFPFNLMVMQVLRENLVLTAMLAAGISVLVPLLGHIIGKQIRIGHYRSGILMGLAGMGLLVAGAYFRMTFVGESRRSGGNNGVLLAFIAIGFVFLVVATFASRYSEPGEDESTPRVVVEAKIARRRCLRELEKCERLKSQFEGEFKAMYERGQALEDERNVRIQHEIDMHNIILSSYWRGVHQAWPPDDSYPKEPFADFEIGLQEPPPLDLWPPPDMEQPHPAAQPASVIAQP